VPRFAPFAGLRYRLATPDLSDVIAPPYDVIAPDEQAALEARSAANAVRVELPRDTDAEGDRYEAAARQLAAWVAEGVLARDEAPSFYLYRMRYDDDAGRPRATTGVIGSLGLEPPGEGDILPHEHTTPKAKSDRLDLLRATRVNLSPVWGLSLTAGLSDLLEPTGRPAARAEDAGVTHELWRVDDGQRVDAIADAVGRTPVVIADGHHRYEVALAYRAEQGAPSAPGTDGANGLMAFVVELAEDQLTVQAIHRLISGLPEAFDLVEAMTKWFEPAGTVPLDASILDRMDQAATLALVTGAEARLLRPRPETLAAAGRDLDSSRLDVALRDLPPHVLTFQHGWRQAADAVRVGAAQAAVLLRPATVKQIADTAHQRERMPPKTTFFTPKLATGLVYRPLD
jgi:uncharacterized protein (DUF1015 family)